MNAPTDQDALFRASVVGASEVAALYDCCPYLTHFELWHRKVGNIAVPTFDAMNLDGTPDNERIFWGIRLEAAIIEAAKELYGYTDREQLPHLTNGKGLGGHPDRRVICPERGPGVLEIKCVDWLVRKSWGDEPPMHYLLQTNTNQGLDGVQWGDVLVLVGGNKLERFCYDFRPKIFEDTQRRVDAFWKSVRGGTAPKPDYTRDGDTIRELNATPGDTLIDLRGDNLAAIAAAEYHAGKEQEKAGKARAEAALAELVDKMGENGTALLDGFTVRATKVAAISDREAKPGEIIKGRKSYCRYTIKEQK